MTTTLTSDEAFMRPDIARQMYYDMLRIRIVEEGIAETYKEQEMRCPIHLSIGQEAVAVGVCSALAAQDRVLSTHRAHAHYLAKGGDLNAMVAELYLRVTGTCQGKGGSMHLVDHSVGFMGAVPIVGSSIPAAVGIALGAVMRREDAVAVAFFGEAAMEEGVFHESVNFAVLKSLPVIFVCENNKYSVNSPLSVRQPEGRDVVRMVEGYGLPAINGDGNDALQVQELTAQAVSRARQGDGPTFLEFDTYRWREHCGPNFDFDLGYRSEDEYREWKQRDPVERLGARLLAEGVIESSEPQAMAAKFQNEIDGAITFAKESEFPGEELLLDRVYAN
jgi:TPP-dependent pyruvate/acetoin dehydrogenase alpha subunit